MGERLEWADNDNAMSLGANVGAGCSGSWDSRGEEVRFVGADERAASDVKSMSAAALKLEHNGSAVRCLVTRAHQSGLWRNAGLCFRLPLREQLEAVERRPHGKAMEAWKAVANQVPDK